MSHSYLSADQIREKFLSFFENKGHLRYPSDSILSPDPTLMFSVAGMQQFKPYFLGAVPKFSGFEGEWYRVTTSQKCVRIGDIENVGRTNRHNSLFEMLGNFSFGDYFKREAILWAWEFLTSPEHLGLDSSRLYVTVYADDDEAFGYWTELGLDAGQIHRFGADENFWPADAPKKGPNGPCGPCSEIFYDRGPDFGSDTWADYFKTRESSRFLEIWNLVFPQFDRQDGGVLAPLPKPNIDTGMGLHRIAAIIQDVPDFYETDLFKPLIDRVAEWSKQPYEGSKSVSHRVIADHIRTVSMSIADGIVLSNTGRGYVIRKVLRRASRHAYLLGFKEPVLHKLVQSVVDTMGHSYPEIRENQAAIEQAICLEEERFLKTLESGIERLKHLLIFAVLKSGEVSSSEAGFIKIRPSHMDWVKSIDSVRSPEDWLDDYRWSSAGTRIPGIDGVSALETVNDKSIDPDDLDLLDPKQQAIALEDHKIYRSPKKPVELSGRDAFTLYDTYGFPLDLTQEIAEEHGISVNTEGFYAALKEQQERARAASKYGKMELFGEVNEVIENLVKSHGETGFVGYERLGAHAKVIGLICAGESVRKLGFGAKASVALDLTPFYAEGGGQVGDVGSLLWSGGRAKVLGTRKTAQGIYLHEIEIEEGTLEHHMSVEAVVDTETRNATQRHHTATHLLHAALRAVLGSQVRQAGSLVSPDRLRFDFTYPEAMTRGQMAEIEQIVNSWIVSNAAVHATQMSIDEARGQGATALFGEKYGDIVRVVSVEGSFNSQSVGTLSSKELCGGCHVASLGEIGRLVLVSEEGTAAGVRRIEALCGDAATRYVRQSLDHMSQTAALLGSKSEDVPERILALQAALKTEQKEVQDLKRKLAEAQVQGKQEVKTISGFKTVVLELSGVEASALRSVADSILSKSGAEIAIVGSGNGLVVKVNAGAVERGAHAGNIVGKLAAAGGGKGGGRPDMAQAGVQNVKSALDAIDTAF